jgi:hypothetical protein
MIRSKVRKFNKKGYIVPPGPGEVKSLIKYFAVSKGVLDNVVQDWRVIFHAGANAPRSESLSRRGTLYLLALGR